MCLLAFFTCGLLSSKGKVAGMLTDTRTCLRADEPISEQVISDISLIRQEHEAMLA
jgi:hypothetical protein